MSDDAPLTPEEVSQAEKLSRAVHDYARNKTLTLYAMAVHRSIITDEQADALMQMWDERHPYEPVKP